MVHPDVFLDSWLCSSGELSCIQSFLSNLGLVICISGK